MIKVNHQRKETLIKTRRKILIRRRFSVSNVKNFKTLPLNIGMVKGSKQRMRKRKPILHKMV
jgi:hypothetical protein